jgi:DNA-binding transcriptional LysR family regulator
VDLTPLRYFVAVAEHGTLTAAAAALHLSQPSLSVALQKLEAELGTTLLLRDRRGATLTETGRTLLAYARELFDLVGRAEAAIRSAEDDEVGHFVLGCPEVLGAYFLPTLMADLLGRYPRIELALWNGPSPAVQQALIAREVHFGLIVNPLPHPDLVLLPLFDDATDLFVAASETPPSTAAEARERLRRGPLIVVDALPQSRELMRSLASTGDLPPRRLSCGNLELVKSLTAGGAGVGVLPRRVAAYGLPGALSRLGHGLPFVSDTIHLVYRADQHRTRAWTLLKDELAAHGRSLAEPADPRQRA